MKNPISLISLLITVGALWFVFIGVDWSQVTVSDWPFLKTLFDYNKGGLQLLAGTLLIMASGFSIMARQFKPAVVLFLLGAFFAAISGTTPFRPCGNLDPNVSCEQLVTDANRK